MDLPEAPFFANPDNTHCYQATLRSFLKFVWPDREYSWEELERITKKVDGLWTWPTAGIMWLAKHGFDLQVVEAFDYRKFAELGEGYLEEMYGKEVAIEQVQHSDIDQERKLAQQLASLNSTEVRTPDVDELITRLGEGYLLSCNVNSRILNDKEGFVGHSVLLLSHDNEHFILHDPGPPGVANRYVDVQKFNQAWAYPNDLAKGYIAMRVNRS